MLLRILQGVQAVRGPEWSCEILLRRGGALRGEFERMGPVHMLSHPWASGGSIGAGLMRKFVDRPWIQPRRLERGMKQWEKNRFDLVYNNTATNCYLVSAARRLRCPILTHVHELGSVLRQFNTAIELAQTMENTDRFIAVSPAAASELIGGGAPADRVTVVPNFLSTLPAAAGPVERTALRRLLGLHPDAAVIVGCGHLHPIKGTDLFVELAGILAARSTRPLCCVWLGGDTDRRFALEVRREVTRRRLESSVRFVGPVAEVAPWFAGSDLVAVTSRVESFSLVALEAAALGRPVVGFQAARGLDDLLGAAPELMVRDLDPAAMASMAERLLADPARALELGDRLRGRVRDSFLAGPRIAQILSLVDMLKNERGR